jgi:hypothetical protein
MSPEERQLRRRWRFYRTAAGHEPVADFPRRGAALPGAFGEGHSDEVAGEQADPQLADDH